MSGNRKMRKMAEALREMQEAQRQIEQMGESIARSARALLDHHAEFRPTRAADYPHLDLAHYEQIGTELAASGFRVLGDVEESEYNAKNPHARGFYRLAASGEGAIVALWFHLRQRRFDEHGAPVLDGNGQPVQVDVDRRVLSLTSEMRDGRFLVTVDEGARQPAPQPPSLLVQYVPDDASVAERVRIHRERLACDRGEPRRFATLEDAIGLGVRQADTVREYRRSLGFDFFPALLKNAVGEEQYAEIGNEIEQAIARHPEWWGGPPLTEDPDADNALPLMILHSEEGELRHLTTVGMAMLGVPELQMRAAANHCLAARLILTAVQRRIAEIVGADPERARSLAGSVLEIAGPNAPAGSPAGSVLLELRDFENRDAKKRSGPLGRFRVQTEFLTLLPPPGHRGDMHEWVRETALVLGYEAPPPLPRAALEAAMDRASESARALLPKVRERFRSAPAEHEVVIKVGIATPEGNTEYIWVKVGEWAEGEVKGAVLSEPVNCPRLQAGAEITVAERDIFDLVDAAGQEPELGGTNRVALEFGLDLPPSGH